MFLKRTASLVGARIGSSPFCSRPTTSILLHNSSSWTKVSSSSSLVISHQQPSLFSEQLISSLSSSSRASISTSSFVLNNPGGLQGSSGSGKSQLSDELQSIMAKKFAEDKQQQQSASDAATSSSSAAQQDAQQEKTPTGWAKYFTREHGWKISFLFFTGMIGSMAIYILIEWGAPRRDDNNQIVNYFEFWKN